MSKPFKVEIQPGGVTAKTLNSLAESAEDLLPRGSNDGSWNSIIEEWKEAEAARKVYRIEQEKIRCTCPCHSKNIVMMHIMACCDNGWIRTIETYKSGSIHTAVEVQEGVIKIVD